MEISNTLKKPTTKSVHVIMPIIVGRQIYVHIYEKNEKEKSYYDIIYIYYDNNLL